MSEPGLTNPWEPWQRLIDSIDPYYRGRLFNARDEAKRELDELDGQELGAIAAEGRSVASSLDEEGARLTVRLTDERERHSRLAADLQRESDLLARRWRWTLAPRRRRQARAEAAGRSARADEHRAVGGRGARAAPPARQRGRHLYPWFERHQDVLARGLAAEVVLDAAHSAVYHVLGPPGIASLTAACLTTDRAIDLGQLQELVKNGGEARQRLLFAVAAELYGREQGVSLGELLAELDGEDLDRVLEAIAVVKRRRITSPGPPDDVWIRAAEPDR